MSFAWKYFSRLDKGMAQCKECDKIIATSSGSTSGLTSHLKSQHEVFDPKRKLEKDSTDDSVSNSDREQPKKKQKTMLDYSSIHMTLDESIARLCAEDNIPFSKLASSSFFKTALKMMFPKETIPKSANTMKRRMKSYYWKCFLETINKIEIMKRRGQKFSISLDEWSSARNIRYLNINVHYGTVRGDCKHINLGMVRVKGAADADRINYLVSC